MGARARRIEAVWIDGPAGRLEALLEEPEDMPAREACLVCHPHPLYGGTMLNKVVYRLARGLRRTGSVVLRFNFRGAGRSEGAHDFGAGEVEDARAALNWLRARYPALPFALAGFSFGSRVALRLSLSLPETARVVAAGVPTTTPDIETLALATAPKFFIQSTNDQFGPRSEMEPFFARLAEPKRLIWIEAADHFFAGGLDELECAVESLPR
jgi:alpha/beta superfamily hydrolase